MKRVSVWRYRLLRTVGRVVTRSSALLTLGRMPPFVSTSVLVADDSRVLVVVDPIRREPILPGGHLTWRERPEDAAVREAREETGIEVSIEELLGVYSGEELAGEGGVVRVIYRARAIGGTLTSSGEGEAMWMPAGALAASDTRDAPILRQWLERKSEAGNQTG